MSTTQSNKLTKSERERKRRERDEFWEQSPARRERHEKLLADGYVLIKGDQREHPAHSEEFVARINALALYIGRGNYNPHTTDRRKLKRAQRLWNRAFSNYYLMTRDPTWWQSERKQPILACVSRRCRAATGYRSLSSLHQGRGHACLSALRGFGHLRDHALSAGARHRPLSVSRPVPSGRSGAGGGFRCSGALR